MSTVKTIWAEFELSLLRLQDHFIKFPLTRQELQELMDEIACVAWRYFSGKTAITNRKVARSLVERQLRNRLQGWPAFFVSSVRWRTGHWIRRLTRQSKFRFSQGTPPRNSIDYNADLWHASRKSFLNMLCKYREIVNCQTRARYSRK